MGLTGRTGNDPASLRELMNAHGLELRVLNGTSVTHQCFPLQRFQRIQNRGKDKTKTFNTVYIFMINA